MTIGLQIFNSNHERHTTQCYGKTNRRQYDAVVLL